MEHTPAAMERDRISSSSSSPWQPGQRLIMHSVHGFNHFNQITALLHLRLELPKSKSSPSGLAVFVLSWGGEEEEGTCCIKHQQKEMVHNLSARHAGWARPSVWAGPEWHWEVTGGTLRSLPALETPRELPQTLEQSLSPTHALHAPPHLCPCSQSLIPSKGKEKQGE